MEYLLKSILKDEIPWMASIFQPVIPMDYMMESQQLCTQKGLLKNRRLIRSNRHFCTGDDYLTLPLPKNADARVRGAPGRPQINYNIFSHLMQQFFVFSL